jgi:hypothetical protein
MRKNNSKEPKNCINRDIPKEEALVSLAEGWSTAESPTAEMLKNSYYAKAFEKLSAGVFTWNWAAAFGGLVWMLFHKMFNFSLIYFLFFCVLVLFSKFIFFIFFIFFSFFLTGFLGNNILQTDIHYRIKHGYHLCSKYKGKDAILIAIPTVGSVAVLNLQYFLKAKELISENSYLIFVLILLFFFFIIFPISLIKSADEKGVMMSNKKHRSINSVSQNRRSKN